MTTIAAAPMQPTRPITAIHIPDNTSLLTDSIKPPTGLVPPTCLSIISKYAYTVSVSLTASLAVPPTVVVQVVNEVDVLSTTVLTVDRVE